MGLTGLEFGRCQLYTVIELSQNFVSIFVPDQASLNDLL